MHPCLDPHHEGGTDHFLSTGQLDFGPGCMGRQFPMPKTPGCCWQTSSRKTTSQRQAHLHPSNAARGVLVSACPFLAHLHTLPNPDACACTPLFFNACPLTRFLWWRRAALLWCCVSVVRVSGHCGPQMLGQR